MLSRRQRPSKLRHGLLVGLVAVLLGALAAPLVTPPALAEAAYATGGTGIHQDEINWFQWSGTIPNSGSTTQTNTVQVNGQPFITTCTLSNISRDSSRGTGRILTPYTPGAYSGDYLDNLYPGTGSIGLATQNAATAYFDIACSATLGGVAYPLDGLVMADAESLASSERIRGTIASSATWRILDRTPAGVCSAYNVNAQRNASNQLTMTTTGECGSGTNIVVAMADGATSITNIELYGGGVQAAAFGVVASFDHSDAPASYGTATHGLENPFSGGTLTTTNATNVSSSSFALATRQQSTPRLGSLVDAERGPFTTAGAVGDDQDGLDDEDAVPTGFEITVAPRQTITYPIACAASSSGTNSVGAWIDFDGNGTFDSDERALGTCSSGNVWLSWVVPDDAASSTSAAPTYARLRIGSTAAMVANPTGVAQRGEVEDHAFTITVPQPSAANDARTTAFETATTVPVLDNDTTGGVAFTPSSVRLQSGSSWVQTLTTAQGTYTVRTSDGAITFTPAAGYVGTAPALTYRVTDEAGRSTTATLTVTVTAPAAPTASDDATTGAQGATQTAAVLSNDAPGVASVPLVPSSVRILDGTSAVTSLTVAGQGTYTVNTSTGAIAFVPVADFVGQASGVRYQVADSRGVTATARYTPTVTQVAVDDASTGPQGVAQTIAVLANDGAQGVTLDGSTLRLVHPTTSASVTSYTVSGQGTWSISGTNVVFTPVAAFTGAATQIDYRVGTTAGTTVQATIAATVTPVTPAANADATTGPQGVAQSVNPYANDSTGNANVGWNASALTLLNGSGQAVSTLAVTGGTYSVSGSTLVFTPTSTFVGTAPSATYRVTNANGTSATSTYTATTTAVTPTAANDVSQGAQGALQRIDPLANDQAGNAAVPLVRSTLTLLSGTTAVSELTVGAQGTWRVVDGQLTFQPLPGFTGVATAAPYRVADANGTTTTATWTATVQTGVSPDASTGPQGLAQTVAVLANDATDVVASTLRLVDPSTGQLATSITVSGQGTYAVQNGQIVFTPVAAFRGAATPVTYDVEDTNGNHRRTTLAVTVTAVNPALQPDTTTGPQGVAQSTQSLANDAPGNPNVPLVPSTLTLLNGSGQAVTSLAVTGGTYALSGTTITFTPDRTFIGTPASVSYRVADANGTTATTTYTPTFVRVTPVAANDAATGAQGLALSVAPLANDQAGNAAVPLAPATLTLLSGGQATDQVVVAGQGTYTIDRSTPSTPRIVFTPESTFVGSATPVSYRVADANGTTTTAAYTPTLTAVTPVANPDAGTARQGAPVAVAPLGNDAAGDARRPLQPTTLALVGANGASVDEVVVAGQGTYRVDRTTPTMPVVRFTPLPAFTGQANPVTYRVADANGTVATSTITPTITPVTPTAANDTSSARQGAPASVAVLANDAAGDAGVPLDPASLRLVDGNGQLATTITVANQGTWSIDRSTASAPRIVFTPLPAFTGEATAQRYRIADANGTTADATVTPTITPVTPTATDDSATTRQGGAVAVVPIGNDDAGDPAVPLVDSSVTLLTPTGQATAERVITGQGTYALSFAANGRAIVTFTPLPGFTGVATPVPYRVADANGTTATASIRITVTGVTPVANPDTGTARQGAEVSVDVVANDARGHADVALVRSSLTLLGANGAAVDLLVVPGQGTYRVDRTVAASPVLAFAPAPAFTGTATPATYRIADANGTTATSTFTPTITAVTPVAANDTSSARQGAAASVAVLANDAAGDAAVPLRPDTLRLLDGAGAATTEVVVAGQGTYTITRADAAAPRVVFTPLPAFSGTATAVTYRVADANGTTTTATVTPTIGAVVPRAVDDVASARQGAPASVAVLANDAAGHPDVPLAPGSVTLLDAQGQPASSVLVDGAGTYTLDTRTASAPRVVFTPLASYVGTPTAATYRVADANGTTTTALVTVTIGAVVPVAVDDVASARQGSPASVAPLANDRAGDADVPLVPSTLQLLDANGAPTATVTVAGGSYAIQAGAQPSIVFTPDAAFAGEAAPVTYRVADANGTTTTARFTPTIGAVTPIARPDAGSARQGAPATIDALANDAAGHADVPLDPATLALLADGALVDEIVVPNEGTWTVDRDGDAPVLVFTPLAAFTGTTTAVAYRVLDANRTQATSTAIATIGAVTPVATDDEGTARQGATVTIDALANDEPGDADVPLDEASLTLLAGDAEVTEAVVDGQGTWTIDRATASLVFTPLPGFTGTAAVDYRVRDDNGTPADATARAILTPVTPIAAPDSGDGRQGATVRIDALANDEAGDADVPLQPATLRLLSGATPVAELVVANEGTWTVDLEAEGGPELVFAPLPGFSGLTTAVGYRVLDANGTQATSTAVATITTVTPLAANDVAAGRQGAPASVAVLANDARGHADVPLVPSTLQLLGADGQPAATVTIDGQGTYAITRDDAAAPRVVFTPVPTFTGQATPVTYRVADANGTTTTATVTPTIDAVIPTAEADWASARQGAAVRIDAVANDLAGHADVPLAPATLALLDGAGAPTDEVVTAAGTWRVDRGVVEAPVLVFTPQSSFVGTTDPVGYRVLDANGTAATSVASATITAVTPAATPDVAAARQGAPASVAPLANDRPGLADVPLVPSTLVLLDGAGNPASTVDVAGGRYAISASETAPRIVFTPAASFTGEAAPVTYSVADANGTRTSSTFTPTITPVVPVATNDRESERQGLAVVIDAVANDTAGHPDVPLVQSTLTLRDGAGNDVDELVVDGRGTWRVDRTTVAAPVLVFTPLPSFGGATSRVTYAVADANGTVTTARATAMLEAVTPVAADDQAAARQGAEASVAPLANDAAGHPDVPLDPETLQLLDANGQPATTVDVTAGTYRIEQVAGVPTLVFAPLASFVGTADPVRYRVADANGTTATAAFTPTISGVQPVAAPDGGAARQGASVTVAPLANDAPGIEDVPLAPETFTLLDADDQPVAELAVAGVGRWTVDRTDPAAPTVTFAPERGFTGDATIDYEVRDENGTVATTTITATIAPVTPGADPDFATARQGAAASVAPLANDDAGHPDVPLDASTLELLDGTTVVDEVTVAGQGTYTLDRAAEGGPRIVFTPVSSFTGNATVVTYRVADANGTTTTATFRPTITAVTPVANPDAGTARQGAPVSMAVLANDLAGDPAVVLRPSTLQLLDAQGQPATTVAVTGGSYAIDARNAAAPRVVFTPDATFVGTADAVTYSVADANGTRTTSTATPTLTAVTPVAIDDASSGRQGAAVAVEPLLNDIPGHADVQLDASTLTLLDGTTAVDALRVPGQGTYAIERGGEGGPRIVFTPESTFVGTAEAVRYRVADANGTTTIATYAATLTAVTPVAANDAATGRQGSTVSVAPLANDVPGDAAVALVPGSLTLLDGTTAVDMLVVANQGTYALDRAAAGGPRVVFTPLPAFVGAATGVAYRVADANGTTTTATFTPTLTAVTPVANPDAGSARQGAPVSLAVLGNDVAGDPAVALDPASLRLVGAGGALVTELVVEAQGTWTIDRATASAPRVVFTPLAAFTGEATAVTYSIADANGTRATASVTPTIDAVTPVANPDVASARQGAAASVAVLANDRAGHPDVRLVPSTLTLLDGTGAAVTTVRVVGGTYTIDASTASAPRVVFTPAPSFVGTAAPVTYRVADANGTTTTSTMTPTIGAVTPVATPDAAEARQGATVTIDALANDRAGAADVPLDRPTLTLLDGETAVDELAIEGQGTWTVDRRVESAPVLAFAPLPTYAGSSTVAYRVADANGTTAASTATATLVAVTPTATDDVASARQGAAASVAVLTNDAAGHPDVALDPASVRLLVDGAPVTTIEVDGVGTWSIDRANLVAARIVFTPVATYVGTPDAVTYVVADANGTTATAQVTATIAAVTPIAVADSGEARQGATVTIDAVANDDAGDPAVPIVASTLTLVDAAGADADEVEIEGQGTWRVDRDDEDAPVLVFTPLPSFASTSTVSYRVADANGTVATSTATAIIDAVTPTARPDVATSRQGATASVAPLANDAAGHDDVPLDPTTLTLVDAAGTPVQAVTVAGQGTYSVVADDTTPRIAFAPEPGFAGTATPARYAIADANGTIAIATVTAVVEAVTPVATADVASARQGAPVSVAPLANDAAGHADVPLDAATLEVLGADGQPAETVTIDGQGTYAIDADAEGGPRIVFTPLDTWVGAATPVTYRVADANGTRTSATFTPTSIAVTPVADPDAATGRQGAPVSIAVLANDEAGLDEVPLDPSTLMLLVDGAPVDRIEVANEGTWTIDRTTAGGPFVVFAPLAGFTGDATAISYRISDDNGTHASAVVDVRIDAVTPTAAPDGGSARQGASVTIDAVANDAAGHPDVPLAPSTLTLLDGETAVDELLVEGQGTWTVDRSTVEAPVLVFAPLPGFVGQSTVAYRVADANGTPATSSATATIGAVLPVANPNSAGTRQGAPVTIDVVANDAAGHPDVPLVPSTLVLLDGETAVDELVVTGEGTWSVDRTVEAAPVVRFAPEPGFSGPATTVAYRVADANGTTAASTVGVRVAPVVPVAHDDEAAARQGAPASVAPLANDAAGHPDVPLVPSTLTLLDADGADATSVTIADAGTYELDLDAEGGPRIVFTPLPGFTGTADAVRYRVADANGTTVEAAFAATITGVAPVAVADAGSARQGAPVTVAPLANDVAGLDEVPLDADSLMLLDADGEPVERLVVRGEGTWSIDRTGTDGPTVTFAPEAGFRGTATIDYEVRDANGTRTSTTIAATIAAVAPTAEADRGETFQGAPTTVDVLANDAAGHPEVPLVPSTLTLLDADGEPTDRIFVLDEGTWTIELGADDQPVVRFAPAAGFRGDAAPVAYRVADANGTLVRAEVVVTVAVVAPVAVDDVASGLQGSPISTAPLANDVPGRTEVPLVPSTLTLLTAAGAPVDVLVVAGEGRYAIDRAAEGGPRIVFTPEADHVGAATPVTYRVADANGTTVRATFTPTATAVTPIATDDQATTTQGRAASIAVLANDDAGHPSVPLRPSTLTLLDAAGDAVSTLEVPEQGTWRIDRTDAAAPRVVFEPLATFTGDATPVSYRIADANGTAVTAEVAVRVTAVTPIAVDDEGEARQGAVVAVSPLDNDRAGAPGVPLVASSLTLLDANGAHVDEVAVPGVGTWTIDRAGAEPRIVFATDPTFTGSASVQYAVADANGTWTTAAIVIAEVTPVTPVATDDAGSALQGSPVRIDPLANDRAGHPAVALDPASLMLLDAAGAPVATREVDGEGTWSIDRSDPATPRVVFTPLPTFSGDASPVGYVVADANGTKATASLGATVTAVEPVATNDVGAARQGAAATIDVLANDAAGHPTVPLRPETLQLVDADGVGVDRLEVAGEGVWTIDRSTPAAPVVTFTPAATFSGDATPVPYRVADANGTVATATVGATIGAVTPIASPDLGTGRQGAPVVVDVLANDEPGDADVPLRPATLQLLDDAGQPVDRVVVDGQGVWTIDRSGDVPVLVFTPEPGFVGTTPAVGYRVSDANGIPAVGTARAAVTAVTPVAADDSSTGVQRATQSVDPLANDAAGDAAVPLVRDSLTLLDAVGAPATVVVVPGEGSYALVDGRIEFTPEAGFVGTATGVAYRVLDANGTAAAATYRPQVTAGAAEQVADIVATAPAGSPVTVDPGSKSPTLQRASVRLLDAFGAQVMRLVVPGEGLWEVDATTGLITFTPEDGFTGDPTPVRWTGVEEDGTVVSGDIVIEFAQDPGTPGPSEPGTPEPSEPGPSDPGTPEPSAPAPSDPGSDIGDPESGAEGGQAGSDLPRTGVEVAGWLALAALLTIGVGLVLGIRRRRGEG
ncbi:CshA/CshB family fibrillar adhesin-related protein [Agrococcus jejuensis]|uniref:CshA-type fibril repeat-containing protein n=1 Tax=Agrococcus jejuensis TaxID=399736 RepID=A0A1G8CBS2_9MICO|nr:CshA/CshB family fibrillar adhesin-related protein [Agrococcus jejuensis]SDH42977.1 CshA-type fibril repeat-containing protein [Agrococcus jejuensis]